RSLWRTFFSRELLQGRPSRSRRRLRICWACHVGSRRYDTRALLPARGFGPTSPAYAVLYPRDGEALLDYVVRAFVRGLVRELLLGPRAYNYDVRVVVAGLYFPEELQSVLARHRDVQEQEVEMVLLQKVEGFLAAPGSDDVMPGA